MSTSAPQCPRCSAVLTPGTLYCVLCGNRTGYRTGLDPAPAGGSDGVGMARLDVQDAGALKRLLAKLIDVVPAAVVSGVLGAVGLSTIETQQVSAVSQQVTLTGFLVFQGLGTLLSLAYSIVIWGWEAKTGKTPGNLLLGLRTTGEDGLPAGWLPIFVRGLIIALGGLLPVLGTVLVLISNLFDADGKKQGWHDKAARTRVFDVRAGRDPLVTGGLGGPASFAPVEPRPGLQPVTSPVPGASAATASTPSTPGGTPSGPAGFAGFTSSAGLAPGRNDGVEDATWRPSSEQLTGHAEDAQGGRPAAQPVSEPAALLPQPVQRSAAPPPPDPSAPAASPAVTSFAPPPSVAGPTPSAAGPAPVVSAPGTPSTALPGHPDDDVEQTRVKTSRPSAPFRILFDNGREVELRSQALIGRNPAGQNGEMIDQLIDFSDQGRSVSKTHLHVRVEGQGLWVTDRNSTNGSAITSPDGQRTPLHGGETLLAQPGSTVHFGDRSFLVVRP